MKADSKEVRSTIVLISAAVDMVLEVRTIHPFPSTEAYCSVKGEGTLCDPFSCRQNQTNAAYFKFRSFSSEFFNQSFHKFREY